MRPIDADALLKNTKAYFRDCIDKQDSEIIDNTILVHNKNISKIIRQAPTVERPRGEWISVEDRLPAPFVTVLVHMPLEKPLPTVHAGYISKDGEWVGGMFKRDKDEVTHWMPLPEAPDDMRGEGE